ncbi:sulfur carrier protein ThiS adenylyltransferase ThiF [Fusobacterium hwasookii]|uniref:Thiamine biosynthesis protein ThiF n=1 Tax=Fusobacterium hwasookii ChDC F206 TaxID=1307443 RepID=A0AAC8WIN5_9FUSO|nr:sulfur carrier protein ThiS adenylyltransferase ThiF [Fusobacterium hwasookii]ALQ34794.1 thiamine biosynthesis protein ThiF [Fusobacterium hwasookii ChDC F206]QNE69080.1 sulfur carrier protein ThiS adenylyltransferase ThiF [Fusobacterium hwasookii]
MDLKEEDLLKRNVKGIAKKLKEAEVCILGLGGLGSNVAVLLARSGIGYLKLIDFDVVEASNLNRQQYRISHIGIKKTEAIKTIIKEINPFVEIDTLDIKVDRENILSVVEDIEIVVEAFDRAETKAMAIEELLTNKNKIVISASGMAGLGSANEIITRKIRDNFYLIGDSYSDYEEYSGIMSTRVMLCAAHQANVVLRLILGEENER